MIYIKKSALYTLWKTRSKFFCLVFFAVLTYAPTTFSANYLCDVYNVDKKVTTLPGSLPDYGQIGRANANQQVNPNTALAYTLCQQAGFKLISTQVAIPGTRNLTSVTKIQQYPDPKCRLDCKPL